MSLIAELITNTKQRLTYPPDTTPSQSPGAQLLLVPSPHAMQQRTHPWVPIPWLTLSMTLTPYLNSREYTIVTPFVVPAIGISVVVCGPSGAPRGLA